MTRRSPLCSVVAAFDGMTSSPPPARRMIEWALAPSDPPSRPGALKKWRSPRCESETSPSRISYSRTTPRPPRNVPAPPESVRSATRWTRIGASISMASAGRFMQFVASAEGDDQKFAGGRGRYAIRQDLGERADHAAGDALDGGGPGIDGGRFLRVDDRALGQAQLDGPEAAAVGRDGGVGERPHGVTRRGQRAGRHAIERPLHLRAGALEVELDVAAFHRDGDLDADRLVELDAVIVEVVDEPIGAL